MPKTRKPKELTGRGGKLIDRMELASLKADLRGEKPASAQTLGPEHLEALQRFSCSLLGEVDFDRLLKTILGEAVRLLGAQRAILFLGRQDSVGLMPVSAVGLHGEALRRVEKVSRTILAECRQGRVVLTDDATADPRYTGVHSIRANRIRSILGAPLLSATGQIGVLYLDAPTAHAFPQEARPLVASMCQIAAAALEGARFHGEVLREASSAETQAGVLRHLLGVSAASETLRHQAGIAARVNQPVLILGEPGTGRGFLARVIHDASPRARGPFVTAACDAAPPAMLPGVFFGRTGLAGTGSYSNESGLLRQADRGSLYLSNASELDERTATALSEVLESGLFRPVGAHRDESVDVRLILSAVSQDPTRRGTLRDLLPPRLQVLAIEIPPLRERPEDIPEFAVAFLRSAQAHTASDRLSFTDEALDVLTRYPWPGNLRQLRTVLHRLLLLAVATIQARDVEEVLSQDSGDLDWARDRSGEVLSLQALEEAAIRQALKKTAGNRAEAAKLLGIHRNTLTIKLRKI